MAKSMDSKKELKKKPAKSIKEKRQEKKDKKKEKQDDFVMPALTGPVTKRKGYSK